jgi:hypothetical protein
MAQILDHLSTITMPTDVILFVFINRKTNKAISMYYNSSGRLWLLFEKDP